MYQKKDVRKIVKMFGKHSSLFKSVLVNKDQ